MPTPAERDAIVGFGLRGRHRQPGRCYSQGLQRTRQRGHVRSLRALGGREGRALHPDGLDGSLRGVAVPFRHRAAMLAIAAAAGRQLRFLRFRHQGQHQRKAEDHEQQNGRQAPQALIVQQGLQTGGDFFQTCLRAGSVGITARRAANSDGADHFIARPDRQPAAQRDGSLDRA